MIKKVAIILIIPLLMPFAVTAQKSGKAKQQMQMPPTVVKTVKAQQKAWQEAIRETGSLSAFNGVMLSSEVSGRITAIYFKSGEFVTKGTPLIQIFPDIVKAELEKAEAILTERKLDYQRNFKLYKKGFVTKAEMDKFRAQLDSAQADVNNSQAQLSERLIRAPFSGNLGLRKVSLGDYINPGEDLVSLQSVDPIRVEFSVPQKYLGGIKVGDTITLTLQAFAKTYSGEVYAFDSIVNENTRSINIRAKIANPEHVLVPGTFVTVEAKIHHPQSVIVIPATSIVYAAGSDYVFVAVGNKAVKTNVSLGDMLPNNQIIVTKGLKAGDEVIAQGQMKLFDGFPIITE